MGTTVLYADAGYSLTEEHWGEDNPGTGNGPWNWTVTYGASGVQNWALYGEDGLWIKGIYNTTPGSPYQYDWSIVGSADTLAGQRPKVTRAKMYLGAVVYFDAEWDQANSGDNLSGDALSVAYFDWSNPSGRGTYPDGTQMSYCRDLSGFENTLRHAHAPEYSGLLDSTANSTDLVLADDAIHFAADRNFSTYLFTTPAAWTLEVEAKFASAGQSTAIIGSWGISTRQNYALWIDATDHVVCSTVNDSGVAFQATSATTIDPTIWHTYRVSRDGSSIAAQVDGTVVASIVTTGTPPVDQQVLGVNVDAVNGWRREAWYRSVKLFSEADHYEAARVNLAPSPGGVLTAATAPRGRVKLGLVSSIDGGPP